MRFIVIPVAFISALLLGNSASLASDTTYGEIQKIDAATRKLVVAAECECGSGKIIEVSFTLKDGTKLTLDKKDAKLADLKTGDRVEVDYEELDDVTKVIATRD